MNKEGSRVICNPVPTSLQAHRVTYDSRPFLVHLVFADLSSLHPSSFHEMIFTLVYKDSVGQKEHRLSAWIYVKITETACVSDELCYLKEEVGQIVHEFRQLRTCTGLYSYLKGTIQQPRVIDST